MQIGVTRVILRRQGSQWHWETSLFALLYTQQFACPQQHYASCMCVYLLCAVHCIMYEKKISQLWKKQVIYCSLPIVQRLIISTERKVKAGWNNRSQPNSETQSGLLSVKCLKVEKKKKKKSHVCAKMQLYWVNGAFIGHLQLPVILYDV